MEKSFTIDSETFISDGYCDKLIIEISISSRYGDDAEWDLESIWNDTKGCEVKFKSLNSEDQEKIEDIASDMAYDRAYDAYFENMLSRSDFERD